MHPSSKEVRGMWFLNMSTNFEVSHRRCTVPSMLEGSLCAFDTVTYDIACHYWVFAQRDGFSFANPHLIPSALGSIYGVSLNNDDCSPMCKHSYWAYWMNGVSPVTGGWIKCIDNIFNLLNNMRVIYNACYVCIYVCKIFGNIFPIITIHDHHGA